MVNDTQDSAEPQEHSNCRFGNRLSLKSVTTPFLKEFPFICIFMTLMDFWPAVNLMLKRATTSENLALIPTYTNLFGRVAILFLFAYVVAAITTAIGNRVMRKGFRIFSYTVTVALFVVCFFLKNNFRLDITPTCFVLLAETSGGESREFIHQYLLSPTVLPTLGVLALCVAVILLAEKYWNNINARAWVLDKITRLPSVLKRVFRVTLLSFLLFGIFSTNIYYKVYSAASPDVIRTLYPPTDPLSSVYTSLVTLRMMEENIDDAVRVNKAAYRNDDARTVLGDSLNIVVVIGESYIKWHSQLYGYELATAPNMCREQSEGQLFVFNDVISSSNSTSVVMKDLFSCNNSSAREQWCKYPAFPAIFMKAGYNVYFWDNQRDFAKMETYSFTLNSFLYNPELLDIFYTQTNEKAYTYDAGLVESFGSTVDLATGKHNLLLLHLNGQHVAPSGRFPHDTFRHFSADSIKRTDAFLTREMKEYIADYDNATLYNDYVLNTIFETYNGSNTIVIYFSDHGEEAYDYRKQCSRDHGEVTAMSLKYQYEIPFVVWCSGVYLEKNPDVADAIRQAVDRPFVLDNLCNMLFNIGGVVTPHYRPQLDLIAPGYKCGKRLVKGEYIYEDIRYPDR